MENLIELLTNNTADMGSWSLDYNDHKNSYCHEQTHVLYHYNIEDEIQEYPDIDFSTNKPIYRLFWYKDTPVGNYCIFANSIEQLIEKVKIIIEQNEKLY